MLSRNFVNHDALRIFDMPKLRRAISAPHSHSRDDDGQEHLRENDQTEIIPVCFVQVDIGDQGEPERKNGKHEAGQRPQSSGSFWEIA